MKDVQDQLANEHGALGLGDWPDLFFSPSDHGPSFYR
jgi:hypothetical protein